MIKNPVAFFTQYLHISAIEQYRVYSPLTAAGIQVAPGMKQSKLDEGCIDSADLILMQRDFARDLDSYERVVSQARQLKKPVVYDLDDILILLPEFHPARTSFIFAPALLPMLQSLVDADLVTVSTPKLLETLHVYNPNITVLPNYLDEKIWNLRIPTREKDKEQPVTIGYMGGGSHTPDILLIDSVIAELINQYGDRLKIVFWGMEPPQGLRRFPQVEWKRVSTYNYKVFAEYFQTQSADIFIAPLEDNLFNRCKSVIKYLEYSTLGAPCVASNIEPYTDVIVNAQNGLLASNLEEWKRHLINLIEDADMRFEIVTNAQATIKSHWLLSNHAQEWIEAYNNLLSIDLTNKPTSIELQVIRSITKQTYDYNQYKNSVIERLNNQVSGKAVSYARAFQQGLQRYFPDQTRRGKTLNSILYFLDKQFASLFKKNNQTGNVKLIQKSPFFDKAWYLLSNPDVEKSGFDPAAHYLLHGGFEGRDPGPNFSNDFYFTNYPDVREENINPLLHYIMFGEKEGRKIQSSSIQVLLEKTEIK